MALASFRKTRPRAPRTSSRRTTSTPSSSAMPCSCNSVATGLFRGASNTASIVAVSAPVRIVSAGWARSPRSRVRASMRIDFPAPVSPVSTFRPGPNGTVNDSMTARFLTLSSLSTCEPLRVDQRSPHFSFVRSTSK